ncbi:AarF/ABC1/UbiB kinase family protein [Sporosarcina sp. Marseille-Q4063]|uniref:ABC1 kinase family protein n=1 Tax=Sporosarcina sp. Marseille-Q4063 TaxID=2810514 RepID=UPI001BB07EF1|nr:AarF/ABC1/UbiB kinase family protein [Sporosarcina sp. Marseille-Q4063]QUW22443.1 AarF/ABC1/UbiB kinase family protein [Sporosarcina sp. Marseille-Q4063]
MFKKRIRHTRRFQEIINAFLKNGFSHFLFRLGLTERDVKKGNEDTNWSTRDQDVGKRLRYTLQELGPTFVKLGQIASSRRDLVPAEIIHELEKLQEHVQAVPFNTIRMIVEAELGDTLENLFDSFNEEPLAAASIGQVHIAQLLTGEEVAIKVQRPNIKQTVETDLEILHEIARFLEENTVWAKTYHIKEIIREFSDSLQDELDYKVEGRSADRVAKQFKEQPSIRIPKIHWSFSTTKILTMEMVHGIRVNDISQLDVAGYDRKLIAERVVDAMFFQVLEKGFFHGDPHPGNIYILPENRVCFLDFGMMGRINDRLKFHFASLIINLQQGDTKSMMKVFLDMGLLNEDTNTADFQRDLDDLIEAYYDVSLYEVSLGGIMNELFEIAFRHKIQIPTEITILGKAILTLESTVSLLDPTFSVMKAVEPFGKRLILERYHPKNILQNSWRDVVENAEILLHLPKDIKKITSTVGKGKLRLDINVQQLQTILGRLDRISNRLSFSIILLAFSILMVGLIIGAAIAGQTNLLWSFPIIEAGSIIATLMFMFLIFSIFRSGRM